MGVKGLQYYTEEHCPNTCKRVSLVNMVKDYYRRTPYRIELGKATIVVDGMSVINKMYGDLDWICGGQWREYYEQWRKFVKCFKDIHIDLVVYFDGCVDPLKRHEWISRRLRKMDEIDVMIQRLKKTKKQPTGFHLPASMATLTQICLESLNVKVCLSLKEADTEIAEYAYYDNTVIGILGQDSDYLIYDTKDYLSINHLDLNTMSTVMYDRGALLRNLRLEMRELPLFSCLLGNDVVPVDMLKPFHRELCSSVGERGTPCATLIPLVSELINRNRWRGNPDDHVELKAISQVVFGHPRNHTLLCDGIRWYFLDSAPPDNSTADLIVRQHISAYNHPAIYNICQNLEYASSEVIEDASDPTLPPAALAYQALRRRAYYILFQKSNVVINEWLAYSANSTFRHFMPNPITPEPIEIDEEMPTLEMLWVTLIDNDTKMKCFLKCLDKSYLKYNIYGQSSHLTILTCILNYLLVKFPGILEVWEVNAFVVHTFRLQQWPLERIQQLKIESVNVRAVHLASLLMRGITTMAMVLGICGHPLEFVDCAPWTIFDGKLFHFTYHEAKTTDVETLCGSEIDLLQVRTMIYWAVNETSIENCS